MTTQQKGAVLMLVAFGLALLAVDHFWMMKYLPWTPVDSLMVGLGEIFSIVSGIPGSPASIPARPAPSHSSTWTHENA